MSFDPEASTLALLAIDHLLVDVLQFRSEDLRGRGEASVIDGRAIVMARVALALTSKSKPTQIRKSYSCFLVVVHQLQFHEVECGEVGLEKVLKLRARKEWSMKYSQGGRENIALGLSVKSSVPLEIRLECRCLRRMSSSR